MADQADRMHNTLVKTVGQSNVAYDPLFEELEDILIDLPGKLEELAQKLHKQGVEGGLK